MEEGTVVGISPDTLVSFLSRQECESCLLLDCRPFMAYNTAHVLDAVNVHCPPILKRRSGGFVALENIVGDVGERERLQAGGYDKVVVYDQDSQHVQSAGKDSTLYSVLHSLLQQVDLHTVYYLVGGYDAFSEDCPLLCVTQQFSPLSTGRCDQVQAQTADDDQPVEILPHLLLGNVQHSSQREVLERLGVTALVNVSTGCANHFPAHFRYLHIPVRDSASEDLSSWFPVANRFIDEVKSEGGRVLVHCHAGRSRSATVCLAYLINTLDLSLDTAFEHVRSRREVIDPNLNFMRQLQAYRQRLDIERVSCGADASVTGAPLSVPLGSSDMSSEACAILSLPRTPREAPAPITVPSSSELSCIPPAYSAADLPPPSPATASDAHCFFNFSGPEFPFPSGSLARTPEIPLPS